MRKTWNGAAAAMLVAFVFVLSLSAAAQTPSRNSGPRSSGRKPDAAGVSLPTPRPHPANPFLAALPSFGSVVRAAGPAVVNVFVDVPAEEQTTEPPNADPEALVWPHEMRSRFRGETRAQVRGKPRTPSEEDQDQDQDQDVDQYAGSGVIIDADRGLIATNAHVVDRATRVSVELLDRRRFFARIVGRDDGTDVAVLEIQASGLMRIRYGDSGKLAVGDFVIAIGNALDLGQSATLGIVSGLNRHLGYGGYDDFIETDAATNAGSSGGALIDLDGELVGMSTAIATPLGSDAGLGFAIPVRILRSIVRQIVNHGNVRRGRIGVHALDVTPDLAALLALRTDRGALVTHVASGSAAEAAGIQVGDVVMSADGSPIATAEDVRVSVAGLHRVGEVAVLTLLRGGTTFTKDVRIGAAEFERGAASATAGQGSRRRSEK
ncbi:MAG TPA: trypsin-like peptidase domain-containing protein [Gammaproteobacteria bacterium]|nr:trypsin-like peptidase domain-containing protein [Gammaproteobacteria bacterium]